MRHYMYITGLILLGLLQGSSTTTQAIPNNQNKTPETDRSLPISINQKGDMIYITSSKDLFDLQVEITDSFGNVLQEEHISLARTTGLSNLYRRPIHGRVLLYDPSPRG